MELLKIAFLSKAPNKSNSADAANMARHFAAAKAMPRLLHS